MRILVPGGGFVGLGDGKRLERRDQAHLEYLCKRPSPSSGPSIKKPIKEDSLNLLIEGRDGSGDDIRLFWWERRDNA